MQAFFNIAIAGCRRPTHCRLGRAMRTATLPDRFVAIDVETASRSPARICAVGAARMEFGQETRSYRSLVHVDGRVRFTHIHGLTAADLRAAPLWPDVWRGVIDVMGEIRTLVAFRASFDRAAILAMSAHYGFRLPRLRFVCAADLFETQHGSKLSLSACLEALRIPFPGRPHEPLADARAAAALVLACLAAPDAVPPP
ncbi:MAG: exonuclease domain-containing protein [Acidobacteriota bacterium]